MTGWANRHAADVRLRSGETAPDNFHANPRARILPRGVTHVTIHRPLPDYFVIVTRNGQPTRWRWEIQRRPKPIGVRVSENGFKTESAAKLAGEKTLRDLLNSIDKMNDTL
jgi:hypothetical protein